MSSPWENNQVNMRFNQRQQEMLEDDSFKQHLKEEYEGFTDFVEKKMEEEKNSMPSLDEQIEDLEGDVQKKLSKLEALKKKKQQQQREEELQQKKKELRDIQNKIRDIRNEDIKSEEQIREEVTQIFRDKADNYDHISLEDSKIQDQIDRRVESKLDNQPDKDNLGDLLEQAQALQEEIAELNGGEDCDWFIDPEQISEVSQA